MASTDTRDVKATVGQIRRLEEAGCEIIRVAVLDDDAVAAIKAIRKAIRIPLIADIHFNHRLAIAAMENGADAVRVNPGNLGREKIREVVAAAKACGASLRIGVNSGSVEKDLLAKYGGPSPEALVESALGSAGLSGGSGLPRVQTVAQILRCADHDPGLPDDFGENRYPSAPRGDRGGEHALLEHQVLHRDRHPAHEGIGDTIRVSVTGDPTVVE